MKGMSPASVFHSPPKCLPGVFV